MSNSNINSNRGVSSSQSEFNNSAITGANETATNPDVIDIRSQTFPPGNGREIYALIASLTRGGISREPGYHPEKVYETMRNSTLFAAWFEALPDDLTGVDLAPLYRLAATGTELHALQARELSWEPSARTMGTNYPGPIGEDGKPHRRNVNKWERFLEEAQRAHEERFKAEWDTMNNGDVPQRLHEAAKMLMELALHPQPATGYNQGHELTEWNECSHPDDIRATAAAVRLCLSALCEIDETRLDLAREMLARHRASSIAIQNVEGVLG